MSPLSTGHVFISYSRRDTEAMLRIVSFLRGRGITAWVDNEKLVPGTPIWEREIEKAIDKASAVVVVLSPDAKESVWVLNELTLADEYKKRVFPVLVRGDFRESVHFRLVTRQFVDLRTNEERGLESLGAALSRYLDELKQIEEERLAAEREAERQKQAELARIAAQKAGEERIAKSKLEAEQLAEEKRLAEELEKERRAKAEAQRLEHERIVEAERRAKERTERLAAQNTQEERQMQAKLEKERPAQEKQRTEQKAIVQEVIRTKTEQATIEKTNSAPKKFAKFLSSIQSQPFLKSALIGIGLCIIATAVWGVSSLNNMSIATDIPFTPAPITESPPVIIPTAINGMSVMPTSTLLSETPASPPTTTVAISIPTITNNRKIISPENALEITLISSLKADGNFASISNDFSSVAIVSYNDWTIKLWNLTDETLTTTLAIQDEVRAVVFSPTGDTVATASTDNTVRLWDTKSGDLLRAYANHVNDVESIAFSLNGDLLASGSVDTTVKLWEVDSGKLLHTFRGHTGTVYDIVFSLDNEHIISSSNDHSIRFWNVKDFSAGEVLRTNAILSSTSPSIILPVNGGILASRERESGSERYMLWDINKNTLIGEYHGFDFALAPDGQTIAYVAIDESKNEEYGGKIIIGSEDRIRIENINNSEIQFLTGCGDLTNDIAFSPNGQVIAATDGYGNICIWNTQDGTLFSKFQAGAYIGTIRFSADGDWILGYGRFGQTTINIWGLKP